MSKPKILAFAGSARQESYNKKLVRIAAQAATGAGGEVTLIDLKDYPLPLFNEDLEAEQGAPENATKLKQLFFEHQGLLISCPEYNSSITPLLKNTIDWVSRRADGESPLQAFKGKLLALMSASPRARRPAWVGARPIDLRQHRDDRVARSGCCLEGERGIRFRWIVEGCPNAIQSCCTWDNACRDAKKTAGVSHQNRGTNRPVRCM